MDKGEKEGKKEDRYSVGAVPTQTQPVVVDTTKKPEDEGRVMATEEALAAILNKIEDLEKALKG